MAGDQLGSLYYDLNIDGKNLDKQLDSADKQVKEFGTSVSDSGEKLKSSLNKAAAGFAVAGAGLTLVSKNATDFTVNLVKDSKALARVIGVTTEEASRLTAALGRMGISADEASAMFGIFSKNIVASTKGSEESRLATEKLRIGIDKTKRQIAETSAEITKNGDKTGDLNIKLKELTNTLASQENALKQNADAFAKIGVKTTDAQGKQKDFNTILLETADAFKKMPDGADKTATAMELFGRSGKEMIKVLNLGADGIKDLEKRADELGLTLNSKTIGAVNDFIQSQKDLKDQTDALKIKIGTATTPVLTEFNKAMADVVETLLDAPAPISEATTLFLAFGGPVFAGASAVLALASSLVQVWPALATFTTVLAGATAAVWRFTVALLANPITWLVLAIVAIGVAIFLAISYFDKLGAVVVTVMDAIQMFIKEKFNDLGTFVVGIMDKIIGAFKNVWNWISANWPLLLAILFGPFGLAVLWITQHWQGILDFFRDLPGKVGDFIKGIASTITKPFRDAFEAVVGFWNRTVGKISFKAPSWVPGFGGKGWSMPKFAKGAIATGPTVGMFGEAGTEAVLPLSYLNRYNTLFDRIENMALGKGDTTINGGRTVVNIGTVEDRQDADYIIRRLDRNSQLEGYGLSPA